MRAATAAERAGLTAAAKPTIVEFVTRHFGLPVSSAQGRALEGRLRRAARQRRYGDRPVRQPAASAGPIPEIDHLLITAKLKHRVPIAKGFTCFRKRGQSR